ncbi:bifunctional 4-hydroxy-2-oxoglutarate aldolase/2-dehydro-3-deoxy-phosphogluconate aldolase [Qingshengfaniella alkalisoli]|uniref:2-dehydro-3-deoxy-phosphogluconate aldolase n=1 Tax=Qingshengfaniella alkalisoli TaxID=2599296 RepID=A0A5B8J4C2_9RHOB|nr:bifunctional 4-hydroxy-2-oxoglutarate aldolase/2-dehydro-3-deoxy-phosphogluconate aldolase [Qingshengfaniella alkalisoli]QDY69367.1 bifunctional 4-hydroxy-2-oxoglutarate aldolase/2-dehydro-3-deoxy-phosphogluconate aldolase [Qingshengfaniella alkalisoli]
MTPQDASAFLRDMAAKSPVVPVLVVEDASTAADMAKALVDGGLIALEVTLRTPQALDAIREMSKVDGAIVGAGTVLTADDAKAAKDAGAEFAVSPGSSDKLIAACEEIGLPLLPGAVTATEAMRLLEHGFTFMKFFPAESSGGAPSVKGLGGPLPQIAFCPTGGVSPKNAQDYLSLPNVACVGGSWVTPKDKVAQGDWAGITALAREAYALRS